VAAESTWELILSALRERPADATFEDAIQRIVFLMKVREGLDGLDQGKGVPHEQVKQRLGL
jgi:hypothetical protein